MKNFGLALIAVLLAIVITSMLAMVGLPLLDSATEGLSQSMRSILALVVILILIGMVAGLSMPIYDWQLKRAEQQAELKKQEEDPNFVRKPLIAFVVLGLICVLIYAYEFLVSSDRNTNVPTQIGENLVYALILFTVFTNFLGKHLSKSQKSFSLVVILAVMTSGSVLTSQMRAQADNESLVRIQDNVLSLLEVQESEDGRIAPLEVTSGAGFAQNENEIMEATITAYLNQLIENNNNYVTELEAIGYESLTDGERIQADTDMSESRFILDRTAAIVDKYEQLNEQTALDFRDNFAESEVSPATRASFLESYDERMEASLERAGKIWDLERQILEDVGELVAFLGMTRMSWYLEGDEFIFETDKNLAVFNSIFARVDDKIAQQDAIREVSADITRGLLDGNSN